MTNEQMKPNRFARWANARAKVNAIKSHLAAGHTVVIGTATKAWQCDERHIEMFKATKTGAYMQNGKRWDCIDFCNIKVYG